MCHDQCPHPGSSKLVLVQAELRVGVAECGTARPSPHHNTPGLTATPHSTSPGALLTTLRVCVCMAGAGQGHQTQAVHSAAQYSSCRAPSVPGLPGGGNCQGR